MQCKKRFARLVVPTTLLLWTCWSLGQLFRDASWFTGILFYLPSPVMVLLMTVSATFTWRKRKIAGVLVACALVPAVFVLSIENRVSRRPQSITSETPLRLVHWNVFHGHSGWDGMVDEIRRCAPDL
jgi:hypothetical protein